MSFYYFSLIKYITVKNNFYFIFMQYNMLIVREKNKQLAFRQYKTLKFKTFPIYLLDFNVNGCFLKDG